jgi:hypothetical protein
MIVESYGIFGLSAAEKIAAIMRPLLKGSAYPKSATPGVVSNLLPHYNRWFNTVRRAPQYTAPWQGDQTAKAAAVSISTGSGFPYQVVDAFLYAMFTSAKMGEIAETRLDPTLKKPLPLDPKKLIYSGIFLGSILGLAWLTGNIKKLVKG